MVIEVHLHTILQRNTETGKGRRVRIELPPGSILAEVLSRLDITMPVDNILLVVNGRLGDLTSQLNDGDIVHIIPALSGG